MDLILDLDLRTLILASECALQTTSLNTCFKISFKMAGRRLPSLNALRAFEAAARNGNFTRAAADLAVTPAAVSNQIRVLEEQIGTTLFRRTSRVVKLTEAGISLRTAVTEGFDTIARAIERIAEASRRPQFTISTTPSFAAKWLMPRLERFRSRHSGIDLRIDASERLVDFSSGEVDCAIRFGNGSYPGLRSEPLVEELVFPVCSPNLLDGAGPLREPRDLLQHTLIHLEWAARSYTWPDWRMWLLAAGVDGMEKARSLHVSQMTVALEAAIAGHGVALGSTTIVHDDLAEGKLIQPFSLSLKGPREFGYYVVWREDRSSELTQDFLQWVKSEI